MTRRSKAATTTTVDQIGAKVVTTTVDQIRARVAKAQNAHAAVAVKNLPHMLCITFDILYVMRPYFWLPDYRCIHICI